MYTLIDAHGNKLVIRKTPKLINTHYGVIKTRELNKAVGKRKEVKTHKGYVFLAYESSIQDQVENFKMASRPIYPYDAGIIAAMLSIKKGSKVLESGTGTGGTAYYFSQIGAEVYSYEKEERFYEKAKENLKGLKNVHLYNKDVLTAKLRKEFFDAVFIDMQEPERAVKALDYCLKPGGFFGVYSPVMDSIKPVWRAFEALNYFDIRGIQFDNKEVIVKKYARVKGLLGFPGFFIFARKR